MITNMSTISLIDKAATPVNHSFGPASRVAENTARWQDREHNSGIAAGFSTYSLSLREPTATGGVYRVKATLAIPKLDLTVPAVPKVLGVARVNCEFIFPDVMSDQDRKNITKMFHDSLTQDSASAVGDNIAGITLPY